MLQSIGFKPPLKVREAYRSAKSVAVASLGTVRVPSNKPLQRTINSSVQLTLVAVWRHTVSAGSDPVSAVGRS
jgi:hypothetical protein